MKGTDTMPALDRLLRASSVAVAGARDDTSTYGGRVWTYLTRSYVGVAVAVNPRPDAVRSRPCVARLEDVDPAPEAVVLATPARTVIELLERAGAMGTRAAVIFSRDMLGHEEKIRAAGTKFGMTILGPNCLGFINANDGVVMSSSISLDRPGRRGPLAFVSQSGALMGVLHARAIDLGLGLGFCASTGSQAAVRVEDILLEIASRDDIRAVGAYLEDIDVPRFTAAARSLHDRGIQLVALKAGSTPAGGQTAAAHSGALASSGQAFLSLARELGVIVVDDPGEILTTLAVTSTEGPRWHVVTSSGGIAAIAADQATAAGLKLPRPPQPPPATDRATQAIPVRLNPTDLDAGPATTAQKIGMIAALAGRPELDGVLVVVNDMPGAGGFLRALSAVAGDGRGRILVASECSQQLAGLWRQWAEGGAAYFPGLAPALRALARVHGRKAGRGPAVRATSPRLVPAGELSALLSGAGLPVAPVREADTAEAACAAADSLGYPVVLKASRLLHRGSQGVRLGLQDSRQVTAAYRELAPDGPVLVQPQAPAGLEFYVGVRADPAFGSLLLIGTGGPAVEELADVVIGRYPLDAERIRELVGSTRAGRWLVSPASAGLFDLDSLVRIADAALRVATEAEHLESLDLNPVVVHRRGATVVDAKASRRLHGSAVTQKESAC
jgi:acyl-CoA synthetase (NDP forming)